MAFTNFWIDCCFCLFHSIGDTRRQPTSYAPAMPRLPSAHTHASYKQQSSFWARFDVRRQGDDDKTRHIREFQVSVSCHPPYLIPSSSMATQNYLVVGATGKQGGAVLSALLSASPAFPIHIYALTRNSDSPRAKSLAAHPHVTVVVGDPASPSSIFSQLDRPVAGVFCVTIPGKVSEESQAEALIDACVKHRVAHFVFTSGDRGGPEVSETTPTSVPNLQSKYRIEKYLKTQAEGRMSWTILRPTTFFDMLSADFPGKGFASMWR